MTQPAQNDEVDDDFAVPLAEELEDGSRDPDELDAEPEWWDEGSDDET